jgi:hypothetical protein
MFGAICEHDVTMTKGILYFQLIFAKILDFSLLIKKKKKLDFSLP